MDGFHAGGERFASERTGAGRVFDGQWEACEEADERLLCTREKKTQPDRSGSARRLFAKGRAKMTSPPRDPRGNEGRGKKSFGPPRGLTDDVDRARIRMRVNPTNPMISASNSTQVMVFNVDLKAWVSQTGMELTRPRPLSLPTVAAPGKLLETQDLTGGLPREVTVLFWQLTASLSHLFGKLRSAVHRNNTTPAHHPCQLPNPFPDCCSCSSLSFLSLFNLPNANHLSIPPSLTHKVVNMGYTKTDELSINTIRVLAVSSSSCLAFTPLWCCFVLLVMEGQLSSIPPRQSTTPH